MIGLDFPLKPEWIHSVLRLWKPHQPIAELIENSLDQAMPDLTGEKTRRNSLSILLRMFVPTQPGNSQTRCTTEHNVWAAFSGYYPPETLAPAFIARIIAESQVAQALSQYMTKRYMPGTTITSSDIRKFAAGRFGERKVVVNAASAFLTTLQSFRILERGGTRSEFIRKDNLHLSSDIFPLIFWAWWSQNPEPQIDLEKFEEVPAFQWLDHTSFHQDWNRFQPSMWIISERFMVRTATLKLTDPNQMEKHIIHTVAEV